MTYKVGRPQSRRRKLLRTSVFSSKRLSILVLIFICIGAYFLFKSFTASPTPKDNNKVNRSGLSKILSHLSKTPTKSLVSKPSYNSTILADIPVAFWAINHADGTEADLTGHGHTGTHEGGAAKLTSMVNGDQAVDFNGSSQYLTIPTSAAFSIPTTHQLTWEGWIKPDVLQYPNQSDNNYVDWMGKCETYSPTCEWESRMYSTTAPESRCNRLSAYAFNTSAGLGSGADWQPECSLLQAGQWLYVVGEYQTTSTPSGCNSVHPGGIDIWVNGVKWSMASHTPTGCMSQYNITPTASTSPLDIGTMAQDTWFKGAVGKVAIYDHLLTQAQISAHYAAMTGAQPSGSCGNSCTIPVPTP